MNSKTTRKSSQMMAIGSGMTKKEGIFSEI